MSVAERARAAVGSRFRFHGRSPDQGFDCVGLAAWAVAAKVPSGYRLRGGNIGDVAAIAERLGLAPVTTPAVGDILLLASGPGQLHLAVEVDGGIVHADATLRRVVERPGPAPWPLLAAWRVSQE